ncbi:MAG: three-Cys-motif partner protein TcmP [bacterium]
MDIPWIIGEHTKVKHELLKKYISPWMKILFNNQERYGYSGRVLYFDGFAGPGLYFTDNTQKETCLGSPLIVAETANKYIKQNPKRKVFMYCIDNEKRCIEMLTKKLDESNKYSQQWNTYYADFDSKINELLDEIEKKGLTKQPMFFFIDPFGYSIHMNTLKRMLTYKRSELFINFMIYEIVRMFREPTFEKIMRELFGTDEFKNVSTIRTPEKTQIYLVNLYCKNMKEIANAKYVMPFRINTPNMGRRPKYYLIHVSNHPIALKLMKDNMAKVSDSGYKFEAIGVRRETMDLFEDPYEVKIQKRILDFIKDKQNTHYDEVEEWAYSHTDGVSKSIKESLMELEKQEKISIKRLERQRSNTVTSGAKISYLKD